MNLGRPELKLHKLHFAVKFSKAERSRGWGDFDCKVYLVQFQPNINEETAKYTEPSLPGEVYLAPL